MEEPIEGRTGEERIVEERGPLVERAIRGEDERATLVALTNDLVEIHGLLALERAQPEVVDDQEIGRREAQESAIVRGIRAGRAELREELMRRGVEDGVAGDAGAMAERLREVILADAGLADEADVFLARDEGTRREVEDLRRPRGEPRRDRLRPAVASAISSADVERRPVVATPAASCSGRPARIQSSTS